jgi:predicted acetyltransferase
MKINWLKREEKDRTRPMWEAIFTEDSDEFLDYYYQVKNDENEIVTLEEDGKDVAMLHLNPYPMRIGRYVAMSHYIVAVATDPDYRHRGYMASLLKESMHQMYRRKEPFTFLMPASEAIYLPFDFRFIYDQKSVECAGKSLKGWTYRNATASDAKMLGQMATEILSKRDADQICVRTVRDEAYYRRQLLEQISENGGIRVMLHENSVAGFFLWGKEDSYEIMEPLVKADVSHEEFLSAAVYSLTEDETTKVVCRGVGEKESRPTIMARIIHLESLLETMTPACDFRMELAVFDPILEENTGVFRLSAVRGQLNVERTKRNVDPDEAIPVSDLVQILFGYKEAELQQFVKPLGPVFLNEVV